MLVYLAYKYKNVIDKNAQKTTLESVDQVVSNLGHKTFILARDIKNWKDAHNNSFTVLPHIIKNIRKADVILAVVNSKVKSTGLVLEMVLAKILRKNLILVKTTKSNEFDKFADKVISVVNTNDLLNNKEFLETLESIKTKNATAKFVKRTALFALLLIAAGLILKRES